jgi:hypothetical protein
MRPSSGLIWLLPVLLAPLACKKQPTQDPESEAPATAGYGSLAWTDERSVQPREVCEHLARMVALEAGLAEPPIDPTMMAECETELGIEAGIRGTDNWNDIAHCVLEARTEADIDRCDRNYPLPNQAGSGADAPAAVAERELSVCAHMIEILMLESAAETGEVPPLSSADRRGLVEDCAASLTYEQRPGMNPDAYEAMLGCIERAQTSEQMRSCE